MNNELLFEKSKELTQISNQLEIVITLIENLEYSRINKDMFPIHHSIGNGLLETLAENFNDVKEKIQIVSDVICPDVMEGDSNE